MKRFIKRCLLILLIIVCIFTCIKLKELRFYSEITLQILKLNDDLAVISSNFYDNPTDEISYKDIVYKTRNNIELKLDVYKANKKLKNGSPVIIYVYGDSWMYGDKSLPSDLLPVVNTLRDNGYTIICTSYELLSKEVIFEKQISDIKDTIRWVHKNKDFYNFNTDEIGIIAPSAGAQLSMIAAYSSEDSYVDDILLSKYPSNVKYVIDMFGPSDLSKINFSEAPKALIEKIGIDNIPKLAKEFSPINYIKNDLPNTLIIHSSKDNLVPYSTSVELYNKGKSYKNKFQLFTLNQCSHYLDNLSSTEAIRLYFKIVNYIYSNTGR